MTVRDMQRAIEPGSIPQGERAGLEASFSQAMPTQEGPVPQGGAPGGESLAIPEDPLGALLSGEVDPGMDVPLTDGLSVGPGAGPMAMNDPMMSTRAEKVRQLALEASSPQIRAAARNELRRMAREGL